MNTGNLEMPCALFFVVVASMHLWGEQKWNYSFLWLLLVVPIPVYVVVSSMTEIAVLLHLGVVEPDVIHRQVACADYGWMITHVCQHQ